MHIKVIKIQPSVIAYIAKGLAHVGRGEKDMAYRACDIAFEHSHSSHVTLLLLTKVRMLDLWLQVDCSSPLGNHRVYGRRTPRCNISNGRSDRYSSIPLHVLCGSGTCTLPYYATWITTDVAERLTCISSRETCTWNVTTTRARYSRSSVHVHDCHTAGTHCLRWSHWQVC